MAQHLQQYEDGLSGKLGDGVYYNRYNKTLWRKHPGSYNKVPTVKQAAARLRFVAAQQFAQAVVADPVLKALYTAKAKGMRTAYSVALSEKLKELVTGSEAG